jgi:hypothetical protein
MIDDLCQRYNFNGWTAGELENLLGKPYPGTIPPYDLIFLVGPDQGFGIDFEWLVFSLDSNGKVMSSQRIVK